MAKPVTLPTNDAIILYFLSTHPALPVKALHKIMPRLAPEGRTIAEKILNNKNHSYRKPIPASTDMERYRIVTQTIDRIREVVPLHCGGRDAVLGYLRYAGVLTEAGALWKRT